jgi:transposase InsO family protein
LCAVIGLAPSTFYDRVGRVPSARTTADEELAERIEKIWVSSGRTYGAPRVHARLARDGVRVGRKRVERIMARRGWRGAYLRRGWATTTRRGSARAGAGVPDLVQRQFRADRPNALWVADLTYVRTQQGFFYLAMVLDVFSRRLVGWMMGDTLHTELVLAALEMAIHRRDSAPPAGREPDAGLIHHSDHGAQYTSFGFSQRLIEAGIAPSLGSVGDSFDNAMARKLVRHHQDRADLPAGLAVPPRSRAGDLRLDRGLVQPTSPPTRVGLAQPARVRAGLLRRCRPVRPRHRRACTGPRRCQAHHA